MIAQEEAWIVATAMQKYGGSFVKCLGEALGHADHINQEKIKQAFPEYWAQYLKFKERVLKEAAV